MKLLIGINRVCYGSCLLSIIAGAFITVLAIWTEQHDVGWKGVSTAAVLIFAAVLVLATNGVIGTKVMEPDGGIGKFIHSRETAAVRSGVSSSGSASGFVERARDHRDRGAQQQGGMPSGENDDA